jgi:predicted MFS family arabinose efflux permease
MIAVDLGIDVKTAALLSSAFAFPYALIQPVLGVTGDFFGKTKLMNVCVLVMSLAALVCVVASNFSLLVAMRVVAGLVAGGVFPVAMALLGDLVPINQRQVAIARLLGIALTANVLGAALSGVIGDLFGWRGVFAILGGFSLLVSFAAFWAFRNTSLPKPPTFNRAAVFANFRGIFADPRAKICFGAVFLEAIFIHGLFPYVGVLLRSIGETRASIAGLLIGCFAIGGIVYSVFVPYLSRKVPERYTMMFGGAVAGLSLAFVAAHLPWQIQIAVFSAFGLGFYMLHSCIQVHVTDLSTTARGAAASLHSSAFYSGQAIGPIIYGFGFAHGGPEPTILCGGAVIVGVGLVCAKLLRHKPRV